ncbi:hypothetical protein Sango_1260600 [Sesamum angolense]|uniref:Uncharacterized protein n=1 Tax=Sesamum angolense TaxID=2727404 RepID=A0AAE2BU48_9LAMI|nr:hypothetical protein Sango_1260600 [Sesamum angolense]
MSKIAHGEAQVIEYYDDPPAPISVETPVAPNMATHWGDVEQMNWDQRMVYDAVGPHFFSAHPNPKPWVPAILSLLKVLKLALVCMAMMCQDYRIDFFDVVRASDQPLYNGCDEFHLSAVTRMTFGWSTASSVVTRGTNLPGIETPNARSPRMPSLDWLCAPMDLHHTGTYSCWPIILTPYNLPSEMCMKPEYMFLTMVIPRPSNPKHRIDVYLEPLIEELLQLWHIGVLTHDHATNQAFMMRAALMWTVNDLPAYGCHPDGVLYPRPDQPPAADAPTEESTQQQDEEAVDF